MVSTLFPTDQHRFDRWCEFHRDNPDIFRLFVQFAKQAKAAGRERYGAHAIGERIRWHVMVETRSADGFKVNDHHWPYYSRLAMLTEPDLVGVFERRDAQFDATDAEILAAHRRATA